MHTLLALKGQGHPGMLDGSSSPGRRMQSYLAMVISNKGEGARDGGGGSRLTRVSEGRGAQ